METSVLVNTDRYDLKNPIHYCLKSIPVLHLYACVGYPKSVRILEHHHPNKNLISVSVCVCV